MEGSLAIGDFSRATHLSVKTLRHYHRVGLLVPASIDPDTGYRRYTTDQIPTAQVIRRFRALEMSLEDIHAVIDAPDLEIRNQLIAAHLDRLEEKLAITTQAAVSLRNILQPTALDSPVTIEHKSYAATEAVAVSETINVEDALHWLQGALGELHATVAAQGLTVSMPAGGIYSNELFSHERGQATVFIPCPGAARSIGRVIATVVPAVELATATHLGPYADIDRTYGLLATYVTEHALAVDGPIREYYVVGQSETSDQSLWRTEIGWPIFPTGRGPDAAFASDQPVVQPKAGE